MKHCLAVFLLAAASLPAALAQSFCASDGQPRPVALVERFINADCEACWGADGPKPRRGELALDWIVPGSKGDDAPLAAAANRDGLVRLQALGRQPPQAADARSHSVRVSKERTGVRVSHGIPFNDYIGASIGLKPAPRGARTAWLALVETIPAGTEGTPVERNLVRNLLMLDWDGSAAQPGGRRPQRFYEARSMGIPEGAKVERLRMVGWVEDAQGRITSMAQSFCTGQR